MAGLLGEPEPEGPGLIGRFYANGGLAGLLGMQPWWQQEAQRRAAMQAAPDTLSRLQAGMESPFLGFGTADVGALGGIMGTTKGVARIAPEAKSAYSSASRTGGGALAPQHSDQTAVAANGGSGAPPELRDPEGRLLTAPVIAGRRTVGGPDVPLSFSEKEAAAVALVDRVNLNALRSELPRNADGAFTSKRGAERQHREIDVYGKLNDAGRSRVLGHELGHAIDDIAGKLQGGELSGVRKELAEVYHYLNGNPTGKKTHPKHRGYAPDKWDEEFVAEAVRLYQQDGDRLRRMAPRFAALWRNRVNDHRVISKHIQFNQLAPIGLLGAMGAAGVGLLDEMGEETGR